MLGSFAILHCVNMAMDIFLLNFTDSHCHATASPGIYPPPASYSVPRFCCALGSMASSAPVAMEVSRNVWVKATKDIATWRCQCDLDEVGWASNCLDCFGTFLKDLDRFGIYFCNVSGAKPQFWSRGYRVWETHLKDIFWMFFLNKNFGKKGNLSY